MITLDTKMTMEGLDLAGVDELLQTKTSRAATFTLSSSSSASSSCSKVNSLPSRISFDEKTIHNNRFIKHSQSLTLECQRRRPIIDDPYQVTPNLQVLNDWMIVSSDR